MVASMARVPLADASCQFIASVFSPLDWDEAKRLLSPGGGLMRVGPTSGHLMELREVLYDEVRPTPTTSTWPWCPKAWPTPTAKPSSFA